MDKVPKKCRGCSRDIPGSRPRHASFCTFKCFKRRVNRLRRLAAAKKPFVYIHCLNCENPLPLKRTRRQRYCNRRCTDSRRHRINRDHRRIIGLAWRQKNREHLRVYGNELKRRYRETLTDYYVRRLLPKTLRRLLIPPAFVEFSRQIIRLRRARLRTQCNEQPTSP